MDQKSKERNKDPSKYPLAHGLIKMHSLCSKFASHADIDSFLDRLETREMPNEPRRQLLFHNFQVPRQPEEYNYYFDTILSGFLLLFRIFKLFFDKKLKIVDPEWEPSIEKIDKRVSQLSERYSRFLNLT